MSDLTDDIINSSVVSESSLSDSIVTPTPDKNKREIQRPNASKTGNKGRGISLNLAVSPVPSGNVLKGKNTHSRSKSSEKVVNVLGLVNEREPDSSLEASSVPHASEELKYEIPLPLDEQLFKMEIEDQIRLLALKEMSIVEIKDSISTLSAKLKRNEKELHKLREVIQRSLYKELNQSMTPSKDKSEAQLKSERRLSNPREEAIASTRSGRRRTISSSSTSFESSSPIDSKPINDSQKKNSSIWNNLTKPLNLIQQFDTMLQNEFEKSLIPPDMIDNERLHDTKRHSGDSFYSLESGSPLRDKNTRKESNANSSPSHNNRELEDNKKMSYPSNYNFNKDDMIQSVSTSLWSFMNDMKTNVLSSLSEEVNPGVDIASDEKKMKDPSEEDASFFNLENGSAVKLNSYPETSEDMLNNSDYDNKIKRKNL